jgi:hypothetical protein
VGEWCFDYYTDGKIGLMHGNFYIGRHHQYHRQRDFASVAETMQYIINHDQGKYLVHEQTGRQPYWVKLLIGKSSGELKKHFR